MNVPRALGVDVTTVGDLDIAASGNAAFDALTPVGGDVVVSFTEESPC